MNIKKTVIGIAVGSIITGGLALGGIILSTPNITSVQFNVSGKTLTLDYTDDNNNEDYIILTNTDIYQSMTEFYSYFTVVDPRGKNEPIDTSFLFGDAEDVFIEQFVQQERQVGKPIMEQREVACPEEPPSIDGKCYKDVQIGTSIETVIDEQWVPLTATSLEFITSKEKKDSKNAKVKKSFRITTGSKTDHILYRAKITHPKGESGEFFIEVIGKNGEYAQLDPWFSGSWTYKQKIEINASKVPSTQTNFPVYLNLGTSTIGTDFWSGVKSDGCDIRILESDDTTETPFEIAFFSTTTSSGELYFLADSISSSATTTFYIYYGNSSASCYAASDTYGSQNVWNSNYKQVWHLPNGTTLSANDSTANANNGTITTALATSGQLDGAAIFGGNTTDKIVSSLTAHSAQRSWDLWVYRTGQGGNNSGRVFDKRVSGGQVENLFHSGNTSFEFDRQFSGGQAVWKVALPTASAWHHLVLTYDSSSATNDPIFYLDGSAVALTTDTNSSGSVTDNADGYVLGNRANDSARNWAGRLEDFKIIDTILTADWITAEYNNQSSPSTFFYIGVQETAPTGGSSPQTDVLWFD